MDHERRPQPSLERLHTRPMERNWALTKLGIATGTRIAAHAFGNLFRGHDARMASDRTFYAQQAQVLADELGQLKGSVMKAGQMLSLHGQYFLPPEAVRVLSQLQDDTPPVAWPVMAPVIERALGRGRLAELEIDERPLAAASLGQVHRARRRRDGLELVLKVQYPGVADAIESDVKTLARLIFFTRLAPAGLSLEAVFAEVREMLHKEVDYFAERRFTEDYRHRLEGDPRFVVPRVLPEYCSDMVLAMTYEPGLHIRSPQVQALPLARRNALAAALLDLFLTEFFGWGMVQTDPHFGNYRFRLDGGGDRIVLLDFGATRLFGRGFVQGYAEMVRGALLGDRDRLIVGSQAIDVMRASFPRAVLDGFAEMCELVVEPFAGPGSGRAKATLLNRDGGYRWGDSDLPRRVTAQIALSAMTRYFKFPPREIVFLHRRLGGVFIALATLRAELAGRSLLLRHLDNAGALSGD